MSQGDFQTYTGIFPDVLLYEATEHEYNEGDWASKAEFCDCFKADEDGLAQKCQAAANARWFAAEELIGKLRAENNRLEDENENLRNEIAALSDRVDELMDEISELPVSGTDILSAMFHAEGAMLAEFSRKEVGMAHIAYDFLLQELESK
jgi:cell division protein FtsB